METSVYNNGVSETRAYNNDNTLGSITFTGAPIGNLTYGWDDSKNKTGETPLVIFTPIHSLFPDASDGTHSL